MSYSLVKYSEKDKSVWNDFVKQAKNGLFFFDRDFMDYHADRFTDHSLMIYLNNKLIAIFPANEDGNVIYSHQGLTFGSLIYTEKLKAAQVLDIFNLMIEYYKAEGFTRIVYKVIPFIFSKIPAQEDLYALFRVNAKLIRRDISSVINLKDKIKYSESPIRRYNKCKKLNLVINENEEFGDYWRLLSTLLRDQYNTKPVHSIEEITSLRLKFPSNIKLYEVRSVEDKLLCGTVIFNFGNVIHTQYLANSPEGREIGALDFLLIYLIEGTYKNNSYFSFGISTENSGSFLNTGLIHQKEMYGGRGVSVDFYEIDL